MRFTCCALKFGFGVEVEGSPVSVARAALFALILACNRLRSFSSALSSCTNCVSHSVLYRWLKFHDLIGLISICAFVAKYAFGGDNELPIVVTLATVASRTAPSCRGPLAFRLWSCVGCRLACGRLHGGIYGCTVEIAVDNAVWGLPLYSGSHQLLLLLLSKVKLLLLSEIGLLRG